ncbi:hypothetical protein EAI_07698, partial [Harpegnathos saltator]
HFGRNLLSFVYYSWGRLKVLIYRECSTTRKDTIRRMRDTIRFLHADKISRATNNFEIRVLVYI